MKIDINFLKEQFKNIKETYDLNWNNLNEYGGVLENDNITINISSERWEEGVIAFVKNKKRNESYSIVNLYKRKGFNNFYEYLTESEKNKYNELEKININHSLIFLFQVLLENHCTDVLSGDFSKI